MRIAVRAGREISASDQSPSPSGKRSARFPSQAEPSRLQGILNPGQPIDPETRAYFEPRFGHDFSRVRVHADSAAASSAKSENAHAYTIGNDLVFGSGLYNPGSRSGRQLLAHELAHVVQQENPAGAVTR